MKRIACFATLAAIVTLVLGQFRDKCASQSGVDGRCIFINDCEHLRSLIQGSPLGYEIVKQSQCGFQENKPLVCCPKNINTKITEDAFVKSSATFGTSAQTTTIITTIVTTTVNATAAGFVTTTATKSTSRTYYNTTATDGKCITLDGSYGICVKLKTCRNLAERLRDPNDENLDYVEKSRCIGSGPHSVCCEENQLAYKPVTNVKYECTSSPDPPDPESECCGRERADASNTSEGQTSIYQYPWMAIMEYDNKKYASVGSLISSLYVLTAAQCIFDPKSKKLRTLESVRLGEFNTKNDGPDCVELDGGRRECTSGAISIPVNATFYHPDYNKENISRSNDIGLIKLKEMAPYNEFIRPICLPTVDVTKKAHLNLRFVIAGWGDVDHSRNSSKVKLHIDLPFYDDTRCQKVYSGPRITIVPDKQICAGGELNVGSCRGDAGGPLMYFDGEKFEITGITSFGFRICGLEDRPDVYTKVYGHLQWIQSIIKS